MHEKTYYPGFSEDIQLEEYEKVSKIINKKYGTKNSALEIRSEFEIAYNKLFEMMMKDCSDKVFEVIWTIMDYFNIDEVKAIRYLNKKNYEMVRTYAQENHHTKFYENIEKDLKNKKVEKKKKKFAKSVKTIMDIFE